MSEKRKPGRPKKKVAVFDIDDFVGDPKSPMYTGFVPLLQDLKDAIPKLKVTLFTIPYLSNTELLAEWAEKDWVELAVHGFSHIQGELDGSSEATIRYVLDAMSQLGVFVPGFKAPYWDSPASLYSALMHANYWVADHPMNVENIPPELDAYVLGEDHGIGSKHPTLDILQVHCHTHNTCNNGVEERFYDLMALSKMDFKFVSEVVRPWRDDSRCVSAQE
ncbi:MAG: hypothetical protein J3T61_00420 [Candidatus Brocadiales bacterium]|nr:hypothetical protein [Candidatus Bathyanammoxibius sp.]